MSGVEVISVLGIISSIIAIIDGTRQVNNAASNAEGLPDAFREVADRLPIVRNILDSAKQYIGTGDVDRHSLKGVDSVVEACEKKAQKLDGLFKKTISAEGATRAERYFSAIKHLGKGSRLTLTLTKTKTEIQLLLFSED